MVGTSVAYRMASDDAERAAIERRRVETDWLMEAVNLFELDGFDSEGKADPAQAREFVRRWRDAPSEVEAMRTLLRDRGMPLALTPDYQARSPTLAKREAERMQQRR